MGEALAAKWWAIALRGVAAIIFALIAFFYPGATMLALVLVFAAYAFVDGLFGLFAVWPAARAGLSWGLLLLEALVNIAVAIIAVAWPGPTVVAFVLLVAAWAVITGVLMLAAAFRLPADYGRWWLALGGLASVVYGVLLFIAPLIGALVLTWWIGAYALVFGISLIALAFKLRGLRAK
jgi:uncharacterized membrane protein HdeD (DUF308 family)